MINMAFMPLYMWEIWDVTPVTDTRTVESSAVFSWSWIRNFLRQKELILETYNAKLNKERKRVLSSISILRLSPGSAYYQYCFLGLFQILCCTDRCPDLGLIVRVQKVQILYFPIIRVPILYFLIFWFLIVVWSNFASIGQCGLIESLVNGWKDFNDGKRPRRLSGRDSWKIFLLIRSENNTVLFF